MRLTFVLLRALGYGVVFYGVLAAGGALSWWQWGVSLPVMVWGTWDHWKRADDTYRDLRRGVWLEMLLVLIWAVVTRNNIVLFVFASPLMRACVHLRRQECLAVAVLQGGCIGLFTCMFSHAGWVVAAQYGSWVLLGVYSFALGLLVRERDKARRIVTMAAFEREQRMRDEERIRIAGELHDEMGQYWTAVVRALDVALAVDGEPRVQFIAKAREAAMQGLQEMRAAIHDWHEGRQTPEQWMQGMELSLARVRELTGVAIEVEHEEIEWYRFEDAMAVAEAIARTTLESVTNAIRHGSATVILISVQANVDQVDLRVQDDGIGFTTGKSEPAGSGIGVAVMCKLAERVGGDWQMEAAKKSGTCVQLSVPYQRAGLEQLAKEG